MNDKERILEMARMVTENTNSVKDHCRGHGVSKNHQTKEPDQMTIMLGTDRGFLDSDVEAGVFSYESPGDTYRVSWEFQVPIGSNGIETFDIRDLEENQSIMDGYNFKAELHLANGGQTYDLYYSACGRNSLDFIEELLRRQAEIRNLIDRLEFLEDLMVDAIDIANRKTVRLKPHYFHHPCMDYWEYIFPAGEKANWDLYPFIS